MVKTRHKQHVLISINPFAGAASRRDEAFDLRAILCAAGLIAEINEDLGQTTENAIELHSQGKLRALVGIGGDGTIAELLNRTPLGLPLAMFPRGTENLLGKFVGLNQASVEKMATTIINGRSVALDAGRVTALTESPQNAQHSAPAEQTRSRLFALMAGFGFDADVVARVQAARSGHIRHLSYIKPILASLRNYKYPKLSISALESQDKAAKRIDARWLFVFNCPAYAGGLPISPHAKCSDGRLDYCTFSRGSTLMAIKYLTMVLAHVHAKHREVETGLAVRMRVESEEAVPIQIDGDPFGYTPAEIECLPGRMTLIVPRDFCSRMSQTAP